jgi:hypothetical protein
MVSRNEVEVPSTRTVCRQRKPGEQTAHAIELLDPLRKFGTVRRRSSRMIGLRADLDLNRQGSIFTLPHWSMKIHVDSIENILQGHALGILSTKRPGWKTWDSDANTRGGRIESLLMGSVDGGAKLNITRMICNIIVYTSRSVMLKERMY